MIKQTKKRKQADSHADATAGFIAMALCDEAGRLFYIDPSLLKKLECPPENIRALNLFDLLADPHDKTILCEQLRTAGDVTEYQTSLHHASGAMIPARISIYTIECSGFTRLLVLLTGYSSSRVKQQQAEARYHLIFNSVPVGITITDKKGNFYALNPAFSGMLGYSPLELHKMNAATLYQTAQNRKSFVKSLYRDKSLRNYETKLVRKDGGVINVLLNADLIDFGRLENAMLSSVRDITETKTIEAQLIKERDFSETILDTSESLIMVFDKEGTVIKFNKACEKTMGYSFADMQAKPYWDIVSPDPLQTKLRVSQMLTERHIDAFESHWQTRDGRLRLIKWANVLLVDEDGRDYIVSTGSDITERRKAHEAVRQANRELEQSLRRLEEKTQDISLLADMEGLLQGCRTVEELCVICAQFVQNLCPQSNGAVYLISEDKMRATAQAAWGDESISPTIFMPADCRSVQHGQTNLADAETRGLPCPHISTVPGGQYLCIPMEAGVEVLGILHASYTGGSAAQGDAAEQGVYFASKLRLLTTAAETAALSMANIMLQNTLRQQSIRDALTSLYNRRYLVEALTRELSRAQREEAPLSVLMLDIDFFKDFNDTYGHDGGDTLLCSLSEFFRQNTRKEDIVCRYGGEEFVIVLPGTRHDRAMPKADALRIGVNCLSVPHQRKTMRPCAISIGVATYPQHGLTAAELLIAVDKALYTAKHEGRNRVASA